VGQPQAALVVPCGSLRPLLTSTLKAMKRMRNLLIIAMIAFCSFHANACSCLEPGTVQTERERSELVFVGRVSSVENRTPQMDKGWFTITVEKIKGVFGAPPLVTERDYPYRLVTFKVSETFKGSPATNFKVVTGMGGGDCGYSFEAGKEYVVYAHSKSNWVNTNICSLTGPASDPRSGLAVLRSGF